MLVNCEVQHERVLLGRFGEPSATPCRVLNQENPTFLETAASFIESSDATLTGAELTAVLTPTLFGKLNPWRTRHRIRPSAQNVRPVIDERTTREHRTQGLQAPRSVPRINLRRHRHLPGELLIIPDAGRHEEPARELWDQRLFRLQRRASCPPTAHQQSSNRLAPL